MSRHRAVKQMIADDLYGRGDDDYDDYDDGVERRPDGPSGEWFTQQEFLEYYGGLEEWHAAAPKPKPAKPAKAKPAAVAVPSYPRCATTGPGACDSAEVVQPGKAGQPAAAKETKPKPAAAEAGGAPAGSAARAPSPPLAPAPPASRQLGMVVVGHVDSGKSTLVGQLLLACGAVDERTMGRYTKESSEAGKASFRYAWLLDQGEEERARGVTIDTATAFFDANGLEVNVLDAPGHRDFVPSMIGGSAQADAALLVVNAGRGEFEAGLAGQTKEHVTVCRSLGVTTMLVGVNQMDAVDWDQGRFEEVRAGLAPLLAAAGFRSPPAVFVPLSALRGENLAPGPLPPPALAAWYGGRSLLEEIRSLTPTPRTARVGARLCVNSVHRAEAGGVAVSGTLQAGTLAAGEPLLLMPGKLALHARSLQSRGVSVASLTAGDHAEIALDTRGVDAAALSAALAPGSVLCDPSRPVPLAARIEVSLRTLSPAVPLTRGQPFELYVHSTACACVLHKIVCGLGKRGERLEERPRWLGGGCAAVVQLQLDRQVCVELHEACRQLGRVVLRAGGVTVAAGVVTRVVKRTVKRTATVT